MNIEAMISQARSNIHMIIDLRANEFISKINSQKEMLSFKVMEDYLTKRGYVKSVKSGGKTVYCKGFVCATFTIGENDELESLTLWHDIPNSKPISANQGVLSYIPVLFEHMERNMN